jgi:hypothetical protein
MINFLWNDQENNHKYHLSNLQSLCEKKEQGGMGIPDLRCRCFLHRQEQGGQDRAFQFRGGLVNYKAHYDLSWFRPLLEGNSPTSSDLIFKMNRGYN